MWLQPNLSICEVALEFAATLASPLWQDWGVSLMEARGERMDPGGHPPWSPWVEGSALVRQRLYRVQAALHSSRVDGDSLDVWKSKVMPLARAAPWPFAIAYLTGSRLPQAVLPSPPPRTLPLSLLSWFLIFFLSVFFGFGQKCVFTFEMLDAV